MEPGFCYLIATAPWIGRYYTPANSYLDDNGDDVDTAVPDCNG